MYQIVVFTFVSLINPHINVRFTYTLKKNNAMEQKSLLYFQYI